MTDVTVAAGSMGVATSDRLPPMSLTGPDRVALRDLRRRRDSHREADAELTRVERELVLYLRSRTEPPGPGLLREIAEELGVHVSRVEAIEKAARAQRGDDAAP